MNSRRFNIVVFNYNRIESFFDNFDKISNFNNELDIITVVTSSYSEAEELLVEEIAVKKKLSVKYISRKNQGIDQYARV